jgi:hypothetical protein
MRQRKQRTLSPPFTRRCCHSIIGACPSFVSAENAVSGRPDDSRPTFHKVFAGVTKRFDGQRSAEKYSGG